jgi:peptide deformylase
MKKRKNRVMAKLRLSPDPILTQVCEPVADGEDVSGIIKDMMHILVNSKAGVGLAAPQAGHLKRVIMFKDGGKIRTIINPIEENRSCKTSIQTECCLSYPGESAKVSRALEINVSGQNLGGDLYYADWPARIIQHEIDHLNGKCKVGE